MQNDDVTWSIISKSHCSFKLATDTQRFCRNEYNVTGLCNRKGCPLANSKYATVREQKGVIFLYVRHQEKVFQPCLQWQKIKLSKNFIRALQQIEDTLVFWPKYFRQKCRQRLLKITQYLARMRKMKLNNTKVLVPIKRKEEKRLAKREEKALIAAKLDNAIEKQLLARLKAGTYERIYNFPRVAFEMHTEEAEEELDTDDEPEVSPEEVAELTGQPVAEATENEMEPELREVLERDAVAVRREDDSDVSFSDEDLNDSDLDGSDEEDEANIEYVADFDESDDDDQQEDDIEDLAGKFGRPGQSKKQTEDSSDSESDEDDDEEGRRKRRPFGPYRVNPAKLRQAKLKVARAKEHSRVRNSEKAVKLQR